MFDRFSSSARNAVIRAQERARDGSAAEITPLHLLLGVVEQLPHEDGTAPIDGLEPEAVEALVEQLVPAVETPPDPLAFDAACKRILELSLREALALGDNHISTTHLLLAITREMPDGVPVDGDTVRERILAVEQEQEVSPWPAVTIPSRGTAIVVRGDEEIVYHDGIEVRRGRGGAVLSFLRRIGHPVEIVEVADIGMWD